MPRKVKYENVLIERLKNPDEAVAYLNAALVEFSEDGCQDAFALSIYYLAKANGNISRLAEDAGVCRKNMYKIFNNQQEPKFSTINKIMNALGYEFKVHPISEKSA